MEDPRYYDGIESGYILLCNGEAEGFTNHNTGDIVCDGTNHEEWKKYGKMGECYVCY